MVSQIVQSTMNSISKSFKTHSNLLEVKASPAPYRPIPRNCIWQHTSISWDLLVRDLLSFVRVAFRSEYKVHEFIFPKFEIVSKTFNLTLHSASNEFIFVKLEKWLELPLFQSSLASRLIQSRKNSFFQSLKVVLDLNVFKDLGSHDSLRVGKKNHFPKVWRLS